jgi:uncharacterized membrane protein YhhN
MNWLFLYIFVSLLHLSGIALDVNAMQMVTKPLLMPILAMWVMRSLPASASTLRWGWGLALAFSTLGDTLLMVKTSGFFMAGLAAFLVAHLFYIGTVRKVWRGKSGFIARQPYWFIVLMVFAGGLLWHLWPGLPGAMRIPVVVYALVIAMMVLSVLNLRDGLPDTAFWPMLGGAVLFMLSDSMIAINRFSAPFSGASLAIMLTYIMGQAGLAWGAVQTKGDGR